MKEKEPGGILVKVMNRGTIQENKTEYNGGWSSKFWERKFVNPELYTQLNLFSGMKENIFSDKQRLETCHSKTLSERADRSLASARIQQVQREDLGARNIDKIHQ